MKPHLPFRLGVPSCLYPLPLPDSAQQLGPVVDDVELVLFEVDGLCNFPTPDEITRLQEAAEAYNLSYTVHLPLDLILVDEGDLWGNPSMEKARRVIQSTLSLNPWAYVGHLDGVAVEDNPNPGTVARWRDRALRILEAVGNEVGDMAQFALENLENYNPEIFAPLLEQLPISVCVDVGHFFKEDKDPFPYLKTYLDRARVIHLHGSRDRRDHRGLDLIPDPVLGALFDLLASAGYAGVLTLEVFEETHFLEGQALVVSMMGERCVLEREVVLE